MIELQIPKILSRREALELRNQLLKRLDDGEEITINLDTIEEFDLAGFNALVAPYYQSLVTEGKLHLQLQSNVKLREMFEISRLEHILNT